MKWAWSLFYLFILFIFYAIRVLHSQQLVWREILRGELSGMERVKWRRFVWVCMWQSSSGPVGQFAIKKNNNPKNLRDAWACESLLRRLPASALLRSPLILPTWTLVHRDLHANRLTQFAKIIQPAQCWQRSRKSLIDEEKIPLQNPD